MSSNAENTTEHLSSTHVPTILRDPVTSLCSRKVLMLHVRGGDELSGQVEVPGFDDDPLPDGGG